MQNQSASINHLPVELHTSILKFFFSISHLMRFLSIQEYWRLGRWVYFDQEAPASSKRRPDIERELRSILLFPFNVASVSRLWHDILVQIPKYWTQVVFDVANDPTPFLNAFSWSKNIEGIKVFIFNGTGKVQDVDKSLEYTRVAAIAEALKPHIHRCKLIIFHVAYASSLPPPNIFLVDEAPLLEDLTLDCRLDDIDLENDTYAMTAPTTRERFRTSFPRLKIVSLTGFWFFYLVRHSQSSWLDEWKCEKYGMSLHISQFKFSKDGPYNLSTFLAHLTTINGYASVYFTDISLDYPYDDSVPGPDVVPVLSANIYFNNVSKDFISELDNFSDIEIDDILSFEHCEIPAIGQYLGGSLTLDNVIDNDEGTSLRNIIKVWSGHEIDFFSCPSFNDEFLSWLGSTNESSFLGMSNCANFSLRGLREFITTRCKQVTYSDYEGLQSVSINYNEDVGTGPEVTEADRAWFEENLKKGMGHPSVSWMVQSERGIVSYYWGY